MPILPPQAALPGGILNPSRVPFWGLNEEGVSCNEDLLYFPDPWDTFFINGIQLPGLCRLQNKSLAELDVQSSKGKNNSGSRLRIFGYKPGAFDVTCRIATPEQWLVLQEVQDQFWAGPARKSKPPSVTVKVSHPDLGRLRVYQAVLSGVPLMEDDNEVDGAKLARFKFNERDEPKAHAAKVASGPIPEDPRLPPSVAPANATPGLPSENPENMSLSGPKISRDH